MVVAVTGPEVRVVARVVVAVVAVVEAMEVVAAAVFRLQ